MNKENSKTLFYRVEGQSMSPTIEDGDIVEVYPYFPYCTGDVIAFKQGQKCYIKRLKRVDNNRLWVESDNKNIATFDSNAFGYIDREQVIGVVRNYERNV